MKMPSNIADRIQDKLQIMVCGPDELSPSHFTYGGVLPEKEAREDWQNTVEVIYRLLKSGLLLLWPKDAIQSDKDLLEFVQALAQKDPFNNIADELQGKWIVPWLGPLLYTSPLCKTLLQKYSLDNYDAPVCAAFIEEVESIFEAAGVSWSNKPLIPISSEPSTSY